jgi:hypothetical protein
MYERSDMIRDHDFSVHPHNLMTMRNKAQHPGSSTVRNDILLELVSFYEKAKSLR